MSTAFSNNLDNFLTLQQASEKLNVSIQILLSWNKHNILKPTITQQGEIGYTKEQIEQFLTIRQLAPLGSPVNPTSAPTEQVPPLKPTVPMTDGLLREDFAHVDLKRALSATEGTIKSTSFRLMVSFATILVVILSAIFSQPEGFLPQDAKLGVNKDNILGAQTSKLNLSDQIISALPLGRDNDKKNLRNEGDDEANRNIEALALYKEKTLQTRTSTRPAILTARTANHTAIGSNAALPSSFASTTFPGKGDETAAIDDLGNIKGDAKADTLATVVGGIEAMMGSDSFKQTTDMTNQIIFLILGLLAVVFIFPKQMAFSFKKSHGTRHIHTTYADMPSPKILEVDQKTDGTVVLSFQGKEYKISKPELSSESDQFIERLMTLTQPGVKEIEYDLFNSPEGVTLTTPLSRLVTRLGFVGIKRDLFFPRTSKSEVLFRKYLTQEDLTLMNLTTEQILNDLVKTS